MAYLDGTLRQRVIVFWRWFITHCASLQLKIDRGDCDAAASQIGNQLESLGLPALCEVGRSDEKYYIMLCPCGSKTQQFVCRYWANMSPEIPNWSFRGFRRPLHAPQAELQKMTGLPWNSALFTVYSTADEEEQNYHLFVVSPVFQKRTEAENIALCRMIFYLFLGEAYTEQFIGEIRCAAAPEATPVGTHQTLEEFCETVRRAPVDNAWLFADDPTAVLMEYSRSDAEDDNGNLREDILVGLTAHPHLIAAPEEESAELAAMGGVFCFFYYPATEQAAQDARQAGALVSAIQHLMAASRLGYVIGRAHGTEYNYIDLFVADEPRFRGLMSNPDTLFQVPMALEYFGGCKSDAPLC